MVLSRLTKITGSGIRTDTNWVGNNANYTGILTAASLGGIGDITATGIITAASFSGDGSGLIGVASTDNIITGTAATFNTYPVDINAGMTVAGVATFAGNVSIAGTLTYEDVTNIDSVGIITGKGADINGDLDVDGHTNLDNVSIAGVTTFSDDVIFNGANFDITYDRSINTFNFDQSFLKFGTNGQLVFRSTGPFSTIDSTAGLIMTVSSLEVKQTSGDKMIRTFNNGAVELYHDDNLRLTTSTKGIQVGTGVTIETNGQATFVGIVTFGSSSTTINGNTDTVNVGTALTLGHSQGLQYHTQNLHAQGFEVNQINASGIITATTFSGSGASLTNLNGSNIASGTVPVARIGTGTKNTSTFYRGDGTFATVTPPAITAINNPLDNRIVTSDGGTTVTAESGITFDGTTFASTGLATFNGGTQNGGNDATVYITATTDNDWGLTVNKLNGSATNYGIQIKAGGSASHAFYIVGGGSEKFRIGGAGNIEKVSHIYPSSNNSFDLGSSSVRWRNIYTQDLQLSNEAKKDEGGNDVDGTWGSYTIQEGESDLFLINKRNGKKYKFNLTEVS